MLANRLTLDCKNMSENENVLKVLEEIRDLSSTHLEEYRKVTQRSLELQEKAVARQEQIGRIYRIALAASGIVILGVIAVLIYLISYLPHLGY